MDGLDCEIGERFDGLLVGFVMFLEGSIYTRLGGGIVDRIS